MASLTARQLPATLIEILGRGAALVLAVFTLGSLAQSWTGYGELNRWWLDLQQGPVWFEHAYLAACGLAFTSFAIRPPRGWARLPIALVLVGAGGFAAANAITVARLRTADTIETPWLSLSQVVSAGLLGLALLAWTTPRRRRASLASVVLASGPWFVLFPLAQVSTFGATDYRRPADTAVVFGARAYADGSPSLALSDRIHTACDLYDEGLVDRLFLSGGPGDGDFSEPEVMRSVALSRGIPDTALILDEQGLGTDFTVAHALDADLGRILAVSHGFHLPRIKLAFRKAGGQAYTVPCLETRPLARMPVFVLREAAAFWVYWLRPVLPA